MEAGQKIEKLGTDWTNLSLADLDKALSGALGEYDAARGALNPYAQAGTDALAQLKAALGLSGQGAADTFLANFRKSPGYAFQMDEGVKALDRSASARGGLYSGAAGKALTTFGQGLADQEWGGALDRLTGLVSGGMNAAGGIADILGSKAGARLNTGSARASTRLGGLGTIADAIKYGAGSEAGGVVGAANAKAAGLGNLVNLIGGLGKFALGGGFGGIGSMFQQKQQPAGLY